MLHSKISIRTPIMDERDKRMARRVMGNNIYIYIYTHTHVLHLTKYEMNRGKYNILSDLNIKSTKDTF